MSVAEPSSDNDGVGSRVSPSSDVGANDASKGVGAKDESPPPSAIINIKCELEWKIGNVRCCRKRSNIGQY